MLRLIMMEVYASSAVSKLHRPVINQFQYWFLLLFTKIFSINQKYTSGKCDSSSVCRVHHRFLLHCRNGDQLRVWVTPHVVIICIGRLKSLDIFGLACWFTCKVLGLYSWHANSRLSLCCLRFFMVLFIRNRFSPRFRRLKSSVTAASCILSSALHVINPSLFGQLHVVMKQ